jgi:hypothetical protein
MVVARVYSSLIGICFKMYCTIFMSLASVLSGIFRLFFVRLANIVPVDTQLGSGCHELLGLQP